MMKNVQAQEVCRWCCNSIKNMTDEGTRICDCSNQWGTSHFSCFYMYVQRTGEVQCQQCGSPWRIDKTQWHRLTVSPNHVRLFNIVRYTVSVVLNTLLLVSVAVCTALVVKLIVFLLTGAPVYVPFGSPSLAVTTWVPFTGGDWLVGTLGLLVSLGLAFALMFLVPRCVGRFRCCRACGGNAAANRVNAGFEKLKTQLGLGPHPSYSRGGGSGGGEDDDAEAVEMITSRSSLQSVQLGESDSQ